MLKRSLGLIIPLLLVCTSSVFAAKFGEGPGPEAHDDFGVLILGVNTTYEATGDGVLGNDLFGDFAQFDKIAGQYGFLSQVDSSGTYTFTAHDGVFLAPGETAEDIFPYTLIDSATGRTSKANLIIRVTTIASNPNISPVAIDDLFSIVQNTTGTVVGSVLDNDQNGNFVQLSDPRSLIGEFGFLVLNFDGSFTYTLDENSLSVLNLDARDVRTERFEYLFIDSFSGKSDKADLIIQIIGNPVDVDGNTIFQQSAFDNVDIEFNDRSVDAVTLNSGQNIRGHLHTGSDKDWFVIPSDGNESIILEVCPQGSSCFGEGKLKSWVLYVFDGDLLRLANNPVTPQLEMEERNYNFITSTRTPDEAGEIISSFVVSVTDEEGQQILDGTNHMYAAYENGFFDDALIGIVDPCFDTNNIVEIGVPSRPKNYFVAISSTLQGGSGGALNTPVGQCGVVSTILERKSSTFKIPDGFDDNGDPKEADAVTITEFITIFPRSDDQYTIKVTRTGRDPLLAVTDPFLTAEARDRSATFDSSTRELNIPKVRVPSGQLYNVTLSAKDSVVRSSGDEDALKFILSGVSDLTIDQVVDIYRATFDVENNKVMIPRVTDVQSGLAYSVILQYHPDGKPWFEVIEIQEIQ